MRPLRRNRNFQLLWIGQVLSDLGSQIGALAYPLLVLALTRSPAVAGLVGTVASLAAFAVRLPAGALADRVDRRSAMIACDAVRAAALALLAALVLAHDATWPLVLAVAVVDRIGDTLFSPAATAALPLIVDDEQLEPAWAATEARQYAANLGGPALGGLLFGLGRAVPFVADAVSYAVSTLTSAGLEGDFRPQREEERRGLWTEALDGLRLLWRDRLLRTVLIQAPLINFAFNGSIFTVTIGLRRHGASAAVIGVAQAVIMAGGLVGAVLAPRIQRRVSIQQSIVLLAVGGGLMFGLAALVMPSPLVALPLALPLLVSPATNASLFAMLLRRTPEAMRGRVTNGLMQVATGLAALSPLASGVVVDQLSARWAVALFALSLAPVAVLAFVLPTETAGD
ncbi:MAG TPA: MFS transporter [Gaiellaceae bacterium]|nr:MFS transporter [Gaiellaceae bacterium]